MHRLHLIYLCFVSPSEEESLPYGKQVEKDRPPNNKSRVLIFQVYIQRPSLNSRKRHHTFSWLQIPLVLTQVHPPSYCIFAFLGSLGSLQTAPTDTSFDRQTLPCTEKSKPVAYTRRGPKVVPLVVIGTRGFSTYTHA